MRGIRIQAFVAAVMALAGVPTPVPAADPTAARLSAALGGSLGDGMSDAGGVGHGKFDSTVELRPARTDVFRRRVLASHSRGQ